MSRYDLAIDKVKRLLDLPTHAQRSPEWYAARHSRLTASDVATALGLNPYETVNKLILKKCGMGEKFNGNMFTRHGAAYEDEARDKYCEQYSQVAFDFGLLEHPTIPWLGGSPDGITASGILLEIKCPVKRAITPEVPVYYYPQLQICMEVADLDVADFIQYRPGGLLNEEEFVVTRVLRDKQWFADNLGEMERVWNLVLYHRQHGCDDILAKSRKRKSPPKRNPEPVPPKEKYMIDDNAYADFQAVRSEDNATSDSRACLIDESAYVSFNVKESVVRSIASPAGADCLIDDLAFKDFRRA